MSRVRVGQCVVSVTTLDGLERFVCVGSSGDGEALTSEYADAKVFDSVDAAMRCARTFMGAIATGTVSAEVLRKIG